MQFPAPAPAAHQTQSSTQAQSLSQSSASPYIQQFLDKTIKSNTTNTNSSNNNNSNSKSKPFSVVLNKPTNKSIFPSGATLVEEEDFNELDAVPTTTILIANNSNAHGSGQGRPVTRHLPPFKLTSATPKNVLQRQHATPAAQLNSATSSSIELAETATTEQLRDTNAIERAASADGESEQERVQVQQLVPQPETESEREQTAASESANAPPPPIKLTPDVTCTETPPAAPTAPPPAKPSTTTTTYSHNAKTTRSWPVIYRNPHHYDYEALYAQTQTQAPTTKPHHRTHQHQHQQQQQQHCQAVGEGCLSFKQNCYSNQFAQSIIYSSSNEDLTTINEYEGETDVHANNFPHQYQHNNYNYNCNNNNNNINSNSKGNYNQTTTTCYYFSPNRKNSNSIYDHPSAVVGNSLQFDSTTAAAATVETLRRNSSFLLHTNYTSKVLHGHAGKEAHSFSQHQIDSPTSLNSTMHGISSTGAGGIAGIGSNASCLSSCCSSCCMGPPPLLFLFVTLLMTTSATAMLCAAIMTDHWEHVIWDRSSLDRYTNRSGLQLDWLLDNKVAMLKPDKRADHRFRRDSVFLVPMHGGIWTLCIDLPLPDLQELRRNPKFPRGAPPCVNYLAGSMENARGEEQRNDWQHNESQTTLQPHLRMQNLSISCSLVCLIILGSAALVGAFGVCQRQISAILITGVMYLLAALFALFTLMIIHFKRQQGRPMLDSDYDGTVDGIVARPGGVAIMAKPLLGARIFLTSWSLDLGWGGVVLCAITSVLWILLSKIMRYNPFSALMI